MTGDCHRNVIGCAGAGDSAHRFRRPDPLRDFGIRSCLAHRNFLQRQPHTALEGRPADVEREVESYLRSFNKADDSRNQRLIVPVGADELCLGESVLEFTKQSVGIVPQQYRRDAPFARCDED